MRTVVGNEYYEINDFWGNKMPMMAMEEAAELIQAISKVERCNPRVASYDQAIENLVEEMADVSIAIQALMARYNIDVEYVQEAMNKKLSKEYDEE